MPRLIQTRRRAFTEATHGAARDYVRPNIATPQNQSPPCGVWWFHWLPFCLMTLAHCSPITMPGCAAVH